MPEPQSKKQKVQDGDTKEGVQEAVENASPQEIVDKLLEDDTYGQTYCEQLGIDLKPNDKDSLFQWLCCAIMFSSGLSEALTLRASQTLLDAKVMGNPKTAQETASDKFVGLLDHKFQRKEQTAKYIHSAASVLLDKYDGDLYKLREEAKEDAEAERKLLQEIKGLAKVGIDIFFREAQLVWDEIHPFIDKRASESAEKRGLPTSAAELLKLVNGDKKKLAVLAAGLTRLDLAKGKGEEDLQEILETK